MYLALCRSTKLEHADMELMTIGMCLDYIDEYNEIHNPKEQKENKPRKATQADIEALKGR
ncbi:hypothetical protein CW357_01095 [Rummeliibacillus sp. TYF005]|nr:hypothetical protein CW357_01095 [Rummeliibacillus sp. TYF005]